MCEKNDLKQGGIINQCEEKKKTLNKWHDCPSRIHFIHENN